MNYPEDAQHEDFEITKVDAESGGWSITISSGWSLFVRSDSPVVPEVGMAVRLYGKGIGRPIRGLFLNGQRVFYRTAKEDGQFQKESIYGKDAADWVARWDRGESVHSVEMGGLGPGYEQAIQLTTVEILRHMLAAGYDASALSDSEIAERDTDAIREWSFSDERITSLGLSGAQFGAALSLAFVLYRRGPIAALTDHELPDSRKIVASRHFPSLPDVKAA